MLFSPDNPSGERFRTTLNNLEYSPPTNDDSKPYRETSNSYASPIHNNHNMRMRLNKKTSSSKVSIQEEDSSCDTNSEEDSENKNKFIHSVPASYLPL